MSDTAADRVKVAKALMDFAIEIARKNETSSHVGIFVTDYRSMGTIMGGCANILQMRYALLGDNYGTEPCLVHVIGNPKNTVQDAINDAVMPVQRGSVIVLQADDTVENVSEYSKMLDIHMNESDKETIIEYYR